MACLLPQSPCASHCTRQAPTSPNRAQACWLQHVRQLHRKFAARCLTVAKGVKKTATSAGGVRQEAEATAGDEPGTTQSRRVADNAAPTGTTLRPQHGACVTHPTWGRRGFTRQPENCRRTFEGSDASNTTKIPREDTQRAKMERRKKARNFGPPPLPHPLWPAPFGAPPFGHRPSGNNTGYGLHHLFGPRPRPDFFWLGTLWAPPRHTHEGPKMDWLEGGLMGRLQGL